MTSVSLIHSPLDSSWKRVRLRNERSGAIER